MLTIKIRNWSIGALLIAVISGCGGGSGNTTQSSTRLVIAEAAKVIHSSSATTVAADYQNAVQELYVAYFGRPADATGLVNFENALLAANAPTDIQDLNAAYNTSPTIQSLLNNFGTSAESKALYGTGNTAEFVSAIYQNVLGRTPVPGDTGAAWWVTAITSGGLTQGNAALSIMAGGLVNTSTQGLVDAQLINNRIAAASYFSAQLTANQSAANSYSGNAAAAAARNMLNGVTATTTASAYQTSAVAAIDALPGTISIAMSFSSPTVNLGKSSTLTWSATNATSCIASGGWAGSQSISGTSTQNSPALGTSVYTLTCTGAGGSASRSASLIASIPVQATSYLNAKNISRAPSTLPVFYQPPPYITVGEFSARAFADFEQNGSLSFFEMSFDWNAQNPSEHGLIKFWHVNNDGTFIEITNKLIPNAADQVGCLNPRKAIVADFNQDGKPDIFVACTGYDGTLNGVLEPGEMPMILLSQPDGTYKVSVIQLSHPMMMHSASAADINGDGYPDIVVADDNVAERLGEPTVFVLKNNKDGTFTEDHSQFQFTLNKSVWSIEIADFKGDGKLEVWLAGEDTDHTALGGLQSSLYAVNGDGSFATTPMITFPANQQYPTPLDVTIGGNGYVYFNRTDSSYDGFTIEKVDLSTCNSTTCGAGAIMYTNTTDVATLGSNKASCMYMNGAWIDFFRILNGKIITDDSCQSPNVAD